MKKVIFIAIAFIGITVTAQRHRPNEVRGDEKREMFKDMSDEDIANLKTKKMALDLNLTETQKSKIKQLNLKTIKEHRLKLEEREKAQKNSTKKELSKEEKLNAINDRLDKQIVLKNEMRSILDEKQFEKWERSTKRKGAKRKHKKRRLN